MSDRRPCPEHPDGGDVLWVPVVMPAGKQYPGSPEHRGELNCCPVCILDQLKTAKRHR